jgi:general stress protein YciG
MTWFKVDDKLHSHNKTRKVLAEAPSALALWVVAGSWSSDNLTDGFVPDHQLPWLIPNGAEEMARVLVAARFWRRVKGGHQFHEWDADGDGTKRNPTREEVENDRRKKAEAGRKGGLARANANSTSQARAKASAQAPASDVLDPPTRPDPTNNKTSSSTAAPSTATPKPGSDDDPNFVRFWAAYPRRVGKGQARRAWATALKKGADPDAVIEAASRHAARCGNQDPQYIPHPSTWLNGERWGDAPDPEPSTTPAGPVMPWELWD